MGGLFASASWVSLWDYIPHEARPFVVIPWVVGTLAALAVPYVVNRKKIFVKEWAVLNHMDSTQGGGRSPATFLKSTPPEGMGPESAAAWDEEQRKVLKEWAHKFKVLPPEPGISKHWLRALAVTAVAAAGTALWAGEERAPRLMEAFNFTAPPVAPAPLDIKAWIAPPKGFKGLTAQYISEGGEIKPVHKNSRLHVTIVGNKPKITLNGQEVPLTGSMAPGEQGQITYQYTPVELGEGAQEIFIEGGPRWAFTVTPDHAPSIAITGAGLDPATQTLKLECAKHDDFGIKSGRLVLEVPGAAPGENVLPSAKLPSVSLPGPAFCADAPAPVPQQ